MSKETWKKEFYPTPPSLCVGVGEAVFHSLRKWIGFRPENLKRHSITGDDLPDMDMYSSGSCALCCRFDDFNCFDDCSDECPLALARDGVRCIDVLKGVDGELSPYDAQLLNDDPEPMICWLEKAQAEV